MPGILFLDVDGVLNGKDTGDQVEGCPGIEDRKVRLVPGRERKNPSGSVSPMPWMPAALRSRASPLMRWTTGVPGSGST